MAHTDTKECILDAAEKLFARQGFHATSLRILTREARVNLAAVNYHFGSKEELIKAVIERRMLPLNKKRMARLHEVRDRAAEKGVRPGVKEALLAFVEPTFAFRKSGAGSRDFFRVIGRSISEPDERVRNIFIRLVEPIFELLFNVLCEALPDVPKEVLYWRLHFTIGALGHTMHMTGSCLLTLPGINPDKDHEKLIHLFINYVSNGMEAPI